MAGYVNVTAAEMDAFLGPQGYKPIALPNVRELVYARRADRDGMMLTLRVYTGIDPNGTSRAVGADAIRALLMYRTPDGERLVKVATSKRVHRVNGWRANLQERLDTLEPGPACDCGAPMVTRKSARGEFYGCSRYPECNHTKEVAHAA